MIFYVHLSNYISKHTGALYKKDGNFQISTKASKTVVRAISR